MPGDVLGGNERTHTDTQMLMHTDYKYRPPSQSNLKPKRKIQHHRSSIFSIRLLQITSTSTDVPLTRTKSPLVSLILPYLFTLTTRDTHG